jgi:hypothetical protein
MKHLVILSLLISVACHAACQIPSMIYPHKIDSLYHCLKTSQGTSKVDVLNGLALHLAPIYLDSSLKLASEARALAEKLSYERGRGVAIFNAGNALFFRMDIKNALPKYFEALRILEGMGPSQELGDLYCQVALFTNSMMNYRKALNIYKRIGNKSSVKYVQLEIPITTGKDSSYILLKQNLGYYRKYNDHDGLYRTLMDLANACFYMKKPEGLAYAEEALSIAQLGKDNWRTANACHKIVNYYENVFNVTELKTDYKKAEFYLMQALEALNRDSKMYQYQLVAETYRELGHLEAVQNRYRTANKYYKKSIIVNKTFLESFDTITYQDPAQKNFYWGMGNGNLAIVYSDLKQLAYKTRDYKKAFEYHIKGDSMNILEMLNRPAQQISIMEANYLDEKNHLQVALLTKQNELQKLMLNRTMILFASITALVLIAMLITLLFIQRKRFHSEQKALMLEQKLLRAQMNPHFIFNSLYSIQNFIVTEKPDKASIYLSKFARLVRNILDNSAEEVVTLEKEISTIENYLELQKVRYAGKFEYEIYIADEIDAEMLMIPPMLAQPFIENAIEHGVKHRETPGFISIHFSLKEHTLFFEVQDNGVGRQKAAALEAHIEPGHRSMATSLTAERLANLNRKRSKKIFLDILDLTDSEGKANGTRVRCGIPI